ncbi:Preprotein translocase subunit [Actinomyces succiniciruminis]|uniref:Preprotein translocase subunit n=2 Tax=Actinomyces succiniciruminis TaxID=1522002 RepID=A0A1L7RE02_9ACTO|nr:Preprotein translocase subunit [Actinomyces succiniciruminis]
MSHRRTPNVRAGTAPGGLDSHTPDAEATAGFLTNGVITMDPMLLMLIIMLLAFWLMSRFARKQQQRMVDEQNRRTEEALVPGTWVRTRAGFYGTVVEIDGDVVTLATPLGDESLWNKSAIVGAEEPPFASAEDEDAVAEATDAVDPANQDAALGEDAGGAADESPEESADTQPQA